MLSKIKQHTFSDGQLAVNTCSPQLRKEISMYMPNEFYKGSDDKIEFYINKDDAIALCEHFELLPKERHDLQVDSGDDYEAENQPYTPQVGEECETRNFALGGDWSKCKVIAIYDDDIWMHLDQNPTSNIYTVGFYEFRPLKTERDILIDKSLSAIYTGMSVNSAQDIIEKLIDEGLIK